MHSLFVGAARAIPAAASSVRCARSTRSIHRHSYRLFSTAEPPKQPPEQPSQSADPQDPAQSPSPDAEKLKAKEAEVVDLTSRLRYLQADFLNLQRNAAREKEQQRDFAITRFASDLLETVDVLTLALKSIPPQAIPAENDSSPPTPSSDPNAPPLKPPQQYLKELYTGVEMTQRLLLQTLFKYHIKPYDPTGDAFDPNLHEAIYQVPAFGSIEPGSVVECPKIGYMIKDRVLRAAQVAVAQEKQ
jgi:molecular chaperone GrpE